MEEKTNQKNSIEEIIETKKTKKRRKNNSNSTRNKNFQRNSAETRVILAPIEDEHKLEIFKII